MALPIPERGLVIRFNYLWKRERDLGRENARYPRPCAVVLSYRRAADDQLIVMVAPITHSAPDDATHALLLPPPVKAHLGLDDAPSWVVVDEVNEFVWPGFDLAPTPQGQFRYGYLPPKLYDQLRRMVLEAARDGLLGRTPR